MKARILLVSALTLVIVVSGSLASFAGVGPVVVVATDKPEIGPTASDSYVAWFVPTHRGANVFAQATDGGDPFRVNPRGTTAITGGIEGTTLVYQIEREGERPDLAMVDLSTGTELAVPDGVNTRRTEFSPSISGDYLLFGRPTRNVESVVLFDMGTGTSQVIYEKTNTERRRYFVIPTQVNGDFAVWQQAVVSARTDRVIAGDVFVYDIAAGTTRRISAGRDVAEYGPSVSADGTVFFGRSSLACGRNATIVQRDSDGTETVIYAFRRGRDFQFSFALDNPGGTKDVYFDGGPCRGRDYADILVLPGVG